MKNKEMGARLEVLEVRYAHQESALEELTRTLLNQEQQVRALVKLTERLAAQLSAQTPPGTDSSGQEPPPHY